MVVGTVTEEESSRLFLFLIISTGNEGVYKERIVAIARIESNRIDLHCHGCLLNEERAERQESTDGSGEFRDE